MTEPRLGCSVATASALLLFFASVPVLGDSQDVVQTFITSTCIDCHEGEDAEAGLDLTQLTWKLETPDGGGFRSTTESNVAKCRPTRTIFPVKSVSRY